MELTTETRLILLKIQMAIVNEQSKQNSPWNEWMVIILFSRKSQIELFEVLFSNPKNKSRKFEKCVCVCVFFFVATLIMFSSFLGVFLCWREINQNRNPKFFGLWQKLVVLFTDDVNHLIAKDTAQFKNVCSMTESFR